MIQPDDFDIDDFMKPLQRQTLAGDVRDFLLNYIRHDKNPLPWNMRTEDQQKQTIWAATEAANHLLERVVELVAAGGRETIIGQLVQFQVKDGVKAVIATPADDQTLLAINKLRHGKVIIALADMSAIDGERKPAKAEPDQGSLLEQESDPETGEVVEPDPDAETGPAVEDESQDPDDITQIPPPLDRRRRRA